MSRQTLAPRWVRTERFSALVLARGGYALRRALLLRQSLPATPKPPRERAGSRPLVSARVLLNWRRIWLCFHCAPN